ncbi:MAG: WecB/TagA/CpsF family glycosyltransferase [Nitrospirae bacterium]|nr:WecB/TagA/CpsF family glycosyltransferase [Nitrospirota bacterium]MBF0540431.1 WecB/TagA/CpsF family glycosyltransferase [Nitrospirota bacterium]
MNQIKFANIDFKGLTKEILLKETLELKIIITASADHIVRANEDSDYGRLLCENYTTFDGQIPYVFAKVLNTGTAFEKVSGSDFVYDICQYAALNNLRVYLLGGYEDSNRIAVEIIRKRFNIEVEGFSPKNLPYPFPEGHDKDILDRISDFKPSFLLVGFGAPKQERWIDQHKDTLLTFGVKWAMGVGGTFDFVSGKIKRAPVFIQRAGLEGIYRLIAEPKIFRAQRLLRSFRLFKYLL